MAHPRNKRERFLIGNRKGIARSDGYWNNYQGISWTEEAVKVGRYKRRNTTKLCSCVMCGNDRKHFGMITMQEQRHDEKYETD